MLVQLRWLRSIDVNSGRNYFQAASNNKDADKEDKYKDKPFVSEAYVYALISPAEVPFVEY